MSIYTDFADVLIVGSGPVGSAFARLLTRRLPKCSVLMVDAGPRLTSRAGMHVMNIPSTQDRAIAQRFSEGPAHLQPQSARSDGAHLPGSHREIRAHPGTHLLDPRGDKFATMGLPAAAMSTNVGGMGAHWTCACPRPAVTERVPFISTYEWDKLCTAAEMLLGVKPCAFPCTSVSRILVAELANFFADRAPLDRPIGPMPMASTIEETGKRIWSGTDSILGPLANPETAPDNFDLQAETICLRLVADDRGVEHAVVEHLPSRKIQKIRIRVAIVAADAIRTPQLLWHSGFKLNALGHYLNDHTQSVCTVKLSEDIASNDFRARHCNSGLRTNSFLGMYWIPFSFPSHPFHGQLLHLSSSPLTKGESVLQDGTFVNLAWFCRKDIRREDYLEFSDSEQDLYGLPRIHIHYGLTELDKMEIAKSKEMMKDVAVTLGPILDGGNPWTLPLGSSLHYQGTTRMGEINDGTSVCDTYSQVWGTTNLYIGGNGVIPMATACNPTLTSVALAIRACEKIQAMLI